MKKGFISFCLVILIAAVALVAFYSYWRTPLSPGSQDSVNFSIASGQGLNATGRQLVDAGLVRSVAAFKFQVLLSGVSKKIQAGDFVLSPSMNLVELVTALTHARTDRRVTLLEGWRREEIALAINKVMGDNNPDYRFDPQKFVSESATVEGKLSPDTYFFPKNLTSEQAVDILTRSFAQKTVGLDNNSGLSDNQAYVLASLIEREARNESERPVVAGILIKRLDAGWPLQVDATVQYLVANVRCRQLDCDWWPRPLTSADLKIASPYNTYAQPGLPPKPITNPSLVSIKAALNPQTSDYWFYIHDSNGQIHYARTIEEHNQNIARYL